MKEKLSVRQQEIKALLIDGKTPKEIAACLNISYDTVLSHQKNIYRKLNVHSIGELIEQHRQANDSTSDIPAEASRKGFSPPKFAIPAGLAIIAVSLLCLLLFAKRHPTDNPTEKQAVPNPLIFTFEDGSPHGWKYIIEPDLFVYDNSIQPSPFKLGKGNKLTEGDVYTINCTFTSDVDAASLEFAFADDTVHDENGGWTRLSWFTTVQRNIQADVEYNRSALLSVTKTSSNLSGRANLLVLSTSPETVNQPTFTFTRLEFIKINKDL
jgi:DNA-binding CsgD family transcriptional regulator